MLQTWWTQINMMFWLFWWSGNQEGLDLQLFLETLHLESSAETVLCGCTCLFSNVEFTECLDLFASWYPDEQVQHRVHLDTVCLFWSNLKKHIASLQLHPISLTYSKPPYWKGKEGWEILRPYLKINCFNPLINFSEILFS